MPEPDEVTMDTEDIPSSTLSIGFIGAGVMASALVDGLVQKSVVDSPSRISCSDPVSFSVKPNKLSTNQTL